MKSYKIKTIETEDLTFKINKRFGEKYNLLTKSSSLIRFGFKVVEAKIIIDNQLKRDELLISSNIEKRLKLPAYCEFNLTISNNGDIVIGPFIGIYMGRKESTLIKRLGIINSYIKNYTEVKGAIFAFTLDKVNADNLTIEGFVFNPRLNLWEKSTLPYPSSIFKKNTLRVREREYFGALYGNRIFNYNTFNKWEMYQRLSHFPEVTELLPPTALYNNPESLLDFLKSNKNIYIKPIAGMKGRGIYNLSLTGKHIKVKTSNEKQENFEWNFNEDKELSEFIQTNLSGKYIMQKTIDIKFDNKVLDFRVGVDKDQTGDWKENMFVSRVSGDSSIVSNRASGGEVKSIQEVLRENYKMNDDQIKYYQNELVKMAKIVSNRLELSGLSLGKLAFDFVIDKSNKNVWILEINSRYPDDTLANKLDNRQTYYAIRHANMMYAKRLAGFKEKDNNTVLWFPELTIKDTNVKFKLYISNHIKSRETYKRDLLKSSKMFNLKTKVNFDSSIKLFVLEIIGQKGNLEMFVKNIKEYGHLSVIGMEENSIK